VDFHNPNASIFATNAGNNHCGNPICADPAKVQVVQDLLSQWATVELSQENNIPGAGVTLPNPPIRTAAMSIPASLPLITSSQAAVIRFNLSALTPAVPQLAGAILEISIQSYNSLGTTYKVFNPRIIGGTAPVSVSGIHVYVRPAAGTGLGTEDVNQGVLWASLNAVANPYPMPTTLPTGPVTGAVPLASIPLGIAAQSAADVITIGFSFIQ
jgi:hypothetical protein